MQITDIRIFGDQSSGVDSHLKPQMLTSWREISDITNAMKI